MVKRMTSPALYELVGTDGFDASAALFEAVRFAVVTVTPEVSVAGSEPMFVTTDAVLKNVPADVPALTVKMNVFVVEGPTVVPPGNVQLIVPPAPTPGDVDGAPSVPAPVLA